MAKGKRGGKRGDHPAAKQATAAEVAAAAAAASAPGDALSKAPSPSPPRKQSLSQQLASISSDSEEEEEARRPPAVGQSTATSASGAVQAPATSGAPSGEFDQLTPGQHAAAQNRARVVAQQEERKRLEEQNDEEEAEACFSQPMAPATTSAPGAGDAPTIEPAEAASEQIRTDDDISTTHAATKQAHEYSQSPQYTGSDEADDEKSMPSPRQVAVESKDADGGAATVTGDKRSTRSGASRRSGGSRKKTKAMLTREKKAAESMSSADEAPFGESLMTGTMGNKRVAMAPPVTTTIGAVLVEPDADRGTVSSQRT